MTLSREDEARLHAEGRIRDLVAANLGIARKVANHFALPGTFDDLYHEAVIGMMRAAEKFEPGRAPFNVYAWQWAASRCQRWRTANARAMTMPTGPESTKALTAMRTGKATSAADLERWVGPDTAQALWLAWNARTSADEPTHDESPESLYAAAEHDYATADKVRAALATLKPRERTLLYQRHMSEDGSTLQECADRFGVSRQMTHKIERTAMRKMRERMEAA